MKRLVKFFSILLVIVVLMTTSFTNVYAGNINTNPRPCHTLKHYYSFDNEGNMLTRNDYYYDKHNVLNHYDCFSIDGDNESFNFTEKYHYIDGNLHSIYRVNNEGVEYNRKTFVYDNLDRLTEIYTEYGKEVNTYSSEYPELVIKTSYYDLVENDYVLDYEENYYINNYGYIVDPSATYTYDSEFRITSMTIEGICTEYFFDPEGLLVEESTYNTLEDDKPISDIEYEYNQFGVIVEEANFDYINGEKTLICYFSYEYSISHHGKCEYCGIEREGLGAIGIILLVLFSIVFLFLITHMIWKDTDKKALKFLTPLYDKIDNLFNREDEDDDSDK